MATLTPDAKKLLSQTIGGLRARLLRDIGDEAERRYRLSVPVASAGLDEGRRKSRARLEAWLDERVRAAAAKDKPQDKTAARERFLSQAVKEAGATLLNRLVLLRRLEALGLSQPCVVTGGWNSRGYREFRAFAPGLLDDATEGYATLIELVFDELATDLPGLFGDVGLTKLFVVPPAALREVVTQLDDEGLVAAWTDDTTLGWVYQYWNDPERLEIDARLDAQNKLDRADLASKTQVFTERYMVEWLLQHSLGFTWLCICKKNGWAPDAERVLPVLEARRAAWRKRRDAGEVALDALMPVASEEEDGGLEAAWKYYAAQPIPEHAVATAPASIREVKLLDPACGSGHFLVIAFGLFTRMYREEARHRGVTWSDEDIATSILAENLHGVDIDPRAIQLAAAGLYLKAQTLAPRARLSRVNLVAPVLRLGSLPPDDAALGELRAELRRDAGIPEELSQKLVASLAGVDDLGSLLKVDAAIEGALRDTDLRARAHAHGGPGRAPLAQGDLFNGFAGEQVNHTLSTATATVLDKLERFLARHSATQDLGLRLDGEQLAAGVRFMRIAQDKSHDIVVGNPPYFGTQSLADTAYIDEHYPESKENLCTAFLDRAMCLVRGSGQVAFVTVRNWLYVGQLAGLRARIFRTFPPVEAADLGLGGFESLPGVEGILFVAQAAAQRDCLVTVAGAPGVSAKESALLCRTECHRTDPAMLSRLPGSPFVYRWSRRFVDEYLERPLLGAVAPVRVGMKTSDNLRFLRCPWEIAAREARRAVAHPVDAQWVPYIKGAAGKAWIEPLSDVVNWRDQGLEIRLALDAAYGQGPQGEKHFFQKGVAFTTIGRSFRGRAHRFPSIFDVAGSSVLPSDVAATVCLLNSRFARAIVEDLNPTVNFQVGDVARIPFRPDPLAHEIFAVLDAAYATHETTQEDSLFFVRPNPSPWRYAQDWAQRAVDRAEGEPLPAYEPEHEAVAPESLVSFAVGVALGRFGARGEGVLDAAPASALPAGVLFAGAGNDTLEHPACALLHAAWTEHGAAVGGGDDLRTYLRKSFFEYHKKLYDNRPIYFPLSSQKKSFVAFVSIHRWQDDTLNVLLSDHLVPEKRRLEGLVQALQAGRQDRASPSGSKAEKRFAEASSLLGELGAFIDAVTLVAQCGPPPPDDKTPKREVDAHFALDLDDGVMINGATLWPLLEPQWKDPKKWWRQIAARSGPKGTHFDWSRAAKRYFPRRVADACERDAVLASAHRSLWRLHPEQAHNWELRLQRDVRPDFSITEDDAHECRSRFLAEHSETARKISDAVSKRQRARKRSSLDGSTRGADG